jgi:hypothetical protein
MISLSKYWLSMPAGLRIFIKKITGYSPYPSFANIRSNVPRAVELMNIHFGTVIGSHRAANLLDSSLARFFTERGHRVTVVLCDGCLPACLNCSVWKSSEIDFEGDTLTQSPKEQGLCDVCFPSAYKLWISTGAKVYKISELMEGVVSEVKDRSSVYHRNINVTEEVVSGSLRYLCKGDENCISDELFTRYAQASLMICKIYNKLLEKEAIDLGVWVHGIYMPHGILNKVFKEHNIPFYNYNTSYRANRYYFTRNETYHHAFSAETAEQLKLDSLSDHEAYETREYLRSREVGSQDWQQFNNTPEDDPIQALQSRGFIDDDRELAVLYTNVVWDARLHFRGNIYEQMEDWITDTVTYFRSNPSKKLIIRVHPGELISHSVSRERVRELACVQGLPENITLVDAESKISSYFLGRNADINLIFATKMGMELSVFRAPVVCCGDAWVRGKGATIDPENKEEYLDILGLEDWSILSTERMSARGLAYANYFFNKKPIFFPYFEVAVDRKSFKTNVDLFQESLNAVDSELYWVEGMMLRNDEIINK